MEKAKQNKMKNYKEKTVSLNSDRNTLPIGDGPLVILSFLVLYLVMRCEFNVAKWILEPCYFVIDFSGGYMLLYDLSQLRTILLNILVFSNFLEYVICLIMKIIY